MTVQAGLCRTWSETQIVGFVTHRPKYSVQALNIYKPLYRFDRVLIRPTLIFAVQTVQEHITVYLNRLVASLSISWYLYGQIVSDTEPPKFTNCPSILKGYADRSRTSGSVHWNDPLVSDNSGSVSLRQTGGPKSEDDLEVGQYTVTYTAYDGENNTATCSFEVIIKRKHIVSLTLVK